VYNNKLRCARVIKVINPVCVRITLNAKLYTIAAALLSALSAWVTGLLGSILFYTKKHTQAASSLAKVSATCPRMSRMR
jgi:hypothetical protein